MISEYLRDIVRRYPQELAIVDGSRRITYGELFELVLAVREWLQRTLDPKPGEVIAVSLDNSWQFVACFFAAAELGCVMMPCNPRWRAAELRSLAGRLGFRGAVVEPGFAAEWNQIPGAIPNDRIFTADRLPPNGNAAATSIVPPIDSAGEDAPALYVATAASTGAPRLVPRSHRNLAATAENVSAALDVGPGRRLLGVVPYYYASGFCNSLIVPLLSGAAVVMLRQFNPRACAELVHREQVDMLFGSPFIFESLMDCDPALLSTLKCCVTAGGRTPASVIDHWRTHFGQTLRQSYGMSEAGKIAVQSAEQPPESSVAERIGQPIRGVEVVVLGAAGRILEPGQTGELAVRSASVMSDYFGEPEFSRSRFHNGFFRTGDLGFLDSAGNVHLMGRMSRVLNLAGVKVDPVEVERVVEMLSAVASCHVDAVPNDYGSEVIRARVVPRQGLQVTRREVIEQCRLQLAEYKLPRVIEFLEDTPVTIGGKITHSDAPAASQLDPQWELHKLVTGHYLSRAIYVAAKLGIADLLKDGPRYITDLAAANHSHAPSLRRLMLLLVSAEIFAEEESGCFRLAPMGQFLRSDTPGSQRAQTLLLAGPLQQRAWSRLLEIVQTGEGPSSNSLFPFLAKYPEEAAIFNDAMAGKTAAVINAFIAAYDCSRFSTIVELGGGYGSLLRSILAANPMSRGILFDLPHVAEGAKELVRAAGLTDRCEVVGGDFFEALPGGGDAYILKSLIHDWDDAQSTAILGNIARAMAPHGKLLLVEMVIPIHMDRSPWSQIVAGSDINMLVNTCGRERSEAEFQRLFQAAGFELTRIVPTTTPWSVVEAVRTGDASGNF
jgi:acyl-CoA synthetase (AMP-forming)/AMP-acid ligase II